MKKILFVCTGNTCRSSMAEALLRYLLEKEQLQYHFSVESAGTFANEEQPASYNSVLALEELGIDLSAHSSRMVTKDMLEEAYIVLTMTRTHKDYLKTMNPTADSKVFTLKEYCSKGKNPDISDPFGGDLHIYKQCRDELLENVSKLIEILKQKL